MSFYKPSAFGNTQLKIYKTEKDLIAGIYKTMMKARKISSGVEKIKKVTDATIQMQIEPQSYQRYRLHYWKKGESGLPPIPYGGMDTNERYLKTEIERIKEENKDIDSIYVEKLKD
jgi:hypothetical protein